MSGTESFTDKVAFITGAGSGIGRATAAAFAEAGADVAVADLDLEALRQTARLVESHGRRACELVCDVTDDRAVAAAVTTTVETFGQLDYAVNNAGVEQPTTALHETTEEDWDRVTGIDLKGIFLSMRHEVPAMLDRGGAIVNLSSGAGVVGIREQATYAAAKHGVIETPMMGRFSGGTPEGRDRVIAQEPVGRMGRPEEVASAILWLCSDLGGFTVGHAMVVDGGQTVGF